LRERRLALACGTSFACFLGSYMRIPIVPLHAASLGADAVQAGAVNGAFMAMAGACSIPAGLLSDRFGRRLPLLAGLALLSGSSFLLYAARTPFGMGLVYLLFGMGVSAVSPALMSHVADITPPDTLGRAIGLYTMALYGGMTLGPAVGGFLGSALGLRPVFLVSGSVILAVLLVALAAGVGRSPAGGGRGSREEGGRAAVLPELRAMASNRRLVPCLVATLGGCVVFGTFVTFVPLYVRSLGLVSIHVGFVFAAQALANALSRLPTGRLSDRVADRGRLVSAGIVASAGAMAALGLFASVGALAAVAAAAGFALGIAFTVLSALVVDSVPARSRGLAMGLYNTAVYAGMMASSFGMGAVVRRWGFEAAFLCAGAAALAALVPFRLLYREERGGDGGEPEEREPEEGGVAERSVEEGGLA
jgi:MFS family permease